MKHDNTKHDTAKFDSVFRSYDIRGEYGVNLNDELAYFVGICFGRIALSEIKERQSEIQPYKQLERQSEKQSERQLNLNKEKDKLNTQNTNQNNNQNNKKICVCYDGRNSSIPLYKALIQGLKEIGAEVISINLGPTPMAYFADKTISPAATIMITGSHNPGVDNGFKFTLNGNSFFGERILELKNLVFEEMKDKKFVPNDATEDANLNIEIKNSYVEYLLSLISKTYINKKVVWDTGNGATCEIIKQLVSKLNNQNIIINSEIDGNFPAHNPDPTVEENLSQLIDAVRKNNYDIGIAFDGDGDRLGVVTKNGDILYGDHLISLFAEDILSKKQNALFIVDVKVSNATISNIEKVGGRVIMYKTGHSWIKMKMKQENADFAGEMSGHIFFKDNNYYDDGIYAALRLLKFLSEKNEDLQAKYDKFPVVYNTPIIKIKVTESQKFKIIENIKLELQRQNYNFTDIDGVRVNKDNGWFLIRASNTESVLVTRCESSSVSGLELIQEEMYNFISTFKK